MDLKLSPQQAALAAAKQKVAVARAEYEAHAAFVTALRKAVLTQETERDAAQQVWLDAQDELIDITNKKDG